MKKETNYETIVQEILRLIGGKENVQSVTHCATRLRFKLKDQSKADTAAIKALSGVMGAQISGEQYQIIIGSTVNKVYSVLCKVSGFNELDEVPADEEKASFTIKGLGNAILNHLSGCITPILPIIVCAGMLRLVALVLGPMMLGLLSETSGAYIILNFAGDAGFYFLPVFLGYTSAKQFKTNVYLGMLMGAVLISPTLIAMTTGETLLDIFGLPVTLVNYSTTVIPIILITWVMSYVDKFFAIIIPAAAFLMLVPFCTVLVMLPLGLCVLGPLGNILSGYISTFFLGLYDLFGPLGLGVIASLFNLLVLTGMHHALNMACIVTMTQVGYDQVVFVGATAAMMSVIGIDLAFILKAKKAENKSLGVSALLLQGLGGLVEPSLYGIMLPYKKNYLAHFIGAFLGAAYMGLMNVKMYNLIGSNVFALAGFMSSDPMNFIHALIGGVIALIASFASVMILGFDE